jgi:hypothetical protein
MISLQSREITLMIVERQPLQISELDSSGQTGHIGQIWVQIIRPYLSSIWENSWIELSNRQRSLIQSCIRPEQNKSGENIRVTGENSEASDHCRTICGLRSGDDPEEFLSEPSVNS